MKISTPEITAHKAVQHEKICPSTGDKSINSNYRFRRVDIFGYPLFICTVVIVLWLSPASKFSQDFSPSCLNCTRTAAPNKLSSNSERSNSDFSNLALPIYICSSELEKLDTQTAELNFQYSACTKWQGSIEVRYQYSTCCRTVVC